MPLLPALTQRTALLAKIETTYNTDSVPTPANDAFIVGEADLRIEATQLERNFYRKTLSKLPTMPGRKLVTLAFRAEMKGSGALATVPKLGTLLRGCGFAQTQVSANAAGMIATPVAGYDNTGPVVTWGKTAAPTKNHGRYRARIVTAGAVAAAKVRITGSPHEGNDNTILPSEEFSVWLNKMPGSTVDCVVDDVTDPKAPTYTFSGGAVAGDVIVISVGGLKIKTLFTVDAATPADVATAVNLAITAAAAMINSRFTAAAASGVLTVTVAAGQHLAMNAAVALGASGATITPSFTGNAVLNDDWIIDLLHAGYHYTPVSEGFESLTLYLYRDGILHRITGCIGNVQFTNEAGQYAYAQFTFTGQYVAPMDAALPASLLCDHTRPVHVEYAQARLGEAKFLKAQSWTIDMGIQVNPRDSVSHGDGMNGVQYSSRNPTGGINPETVWESEEPFWRYHAEGHLLSFHARVGSVPGNTVRYMSESTQIASIGYTDRNNNLVYDMQLSFPTDTCAGDDELRIIFA